MNRRKFINLSGLGITSFSIPNFIQSTTPSNSIQPIVASTWDAGLRANVAAWDVLKNGGIALDAVEQGVFNTHLITFRNFQKNGIGEMPHITGYLTSASDADKGKYRLKGWFNEDGTIRIELVD